MIKLFTDSSSYIPLDLQEKYNITVLPLTVIVDGKEYYETEISNESFYSLIRKNSEIPQSRPVEVSTLISAFEEEILKGNTVIAIFLSAKVSDTYDNAIKAKNKLLEKYSKANITIIDSKSTCMQEGLVVLSAAEAIQNGAWLEGIIQSANDTINRTRFLFIPETLKYLEIGGRIGKAQAVLGSALQITPILTPKDGEITLLESVYVRNRAISKALDIFKDDSEKYDAEKVFIVHIDAINIALEVVEKIQKLTDVEVVVSDIGPSIGAHVGPGAVGIVYKTLEEIPKSER